MSTERDDEALEERLQAYRPRAPRPELRARILAGAEPVGTAPVTWPVWWALAALLLVALGLHLKYGPAAGPVPSPPRAVAPSAAAPLPEQPGAASPPRVAVAVPVRPRRAPGRHTLAVQPEILVPAGQREALRRFVAELRKAPVEPASFLPHFELPQMKEIAAAPPPWAAAEADLALLESAPAEVRALE